MTISVRLSEEETNLIKEYAIANGISTSELVRTAVMEHIEDDLKLDEERILQAKRQSEKERIYAHTEVWDMLDV